MSRSFQGHLKVKQTKILNKKTFFTVFCCKGVFHKAAADIFWLGSLPTRILGGTVNTVPKHPRHPHLGTKDDMGWGCPLLGFYCRVRSRSDQGHFKVKPAIISNKNKFLEFPYVFCCKKVFHKAEVDILWLEGIPTRILGGKVTICGLEG